jgi:hypothetical protein
MRNDSQASPDSPRHSENAPILLQVLNWALLAACIVRLWIVPLSSSFWVDETVTAFVVQYPNHPSLAIAPQVPASTYYLLPRMAQSLFGLSEIAYRIPSVLVMGVALFLVGRLAARLIHTHAAWFAIFACLGLRGVNYHAADARPYALGICVAAAGLYFLIRWLDSARWLDALQFVLFAALLWSIHLIYWPFYLVYALYPALRIVRRETTVGGWQAAGVFGLLGLALVPEALKAILVLREAPAHVVAYVPGFREFQHAIRWSLVVICGGAASLLAWLFGWRPNRTNWSSTSLIVAWWLSQPICLYLFSNFTGDSVFLDRYLSIALPGIALTATAAAAAWIPSEHWRASSIALGIGVLMVMGKWSTPMPRHDNSDWRSAAREENRLAISPEMPVICPSPFIEARSPVWHPDYALPGFLYAHLSVYSVKGKPYLFPFGAAAADAEEYASDLTNDTLSRSGRFVIYGANKYWREWFAARPELAGWHSRLEKFGDIEVAVFDNFSFVPGRALLPGAAANSLATHPASALE